MAIAKYSLTALDCPDPHALAAFYSHITGWPVADRPDDSEWVWLESGVHATLAFQRSAGQRPPSWPDGDVPQQAHLDFEVDDLDAGEAELLAIGAVKHDFQPEPDAFRVYLDPAGHPFCLVLAGAS